MKKDIQNITDLNCKRKEDLIRTKENLKRNMKEEDSKIDSKMILEGDLEEDSSKMISKNNKNQNCEQSY